MLNKEEYQAWCAELEQRRASMRTDEEMNARGFEVLAEVGEKSFNNSKVVIVPPIVTTVTKS